MLLLGIITGRYAGIPILMILLTAAAGILTVLVLHRKIWFWHFFLLFFLVLGFFRMREIKNASFIPSDGIYQVAGKVNKIVEKDGYRQIFVYDAMAEKGQEHTRISGIILQVSEDNPGFLEEFLPGDVIMAQVSLKEYENSRNPGNFDLKNYYETMNITCYGWCDEITAVQKNNNPVMRGIFSFKKRLKKVYEEIGIGRDAGVYCSLVLGDKSMLDTAIKLLYQANGIAHILAISGLHISILGMGFYSFLRKCCIPFGVSFLCGSFVMVSYGVMTGNSVSTVRALVMFLCCIFAGVVGKTYDSISALSLAAVWILVSYPKMLWNTGFLLSFLAVTGVVVVKPAVSQALGNPESKPVNAFLVSLSVSLVTLPVLLDAYYEIAVYSVFLNLIIIPLMTLLMISVVSAGLFGIFSLSAGTFIIGTAHYILWFYQWICQIFMGLPGAVMIMGKPEKILVFVYYLLLVFFIILMSTKAGEKRFCRETILGITVCFCILCMKIHFTPDFFVRMLDVGQGDAVHICADGENMLIDGGSSDVKNVGEYRLLPYLKSQGIRRLRYVVLTHADYDHYGGLLELMEDKSISIEYLLLPDVAVKSESYQKVEKTAEKTGVTIKYVSTGTKLSCGSAGLSVLYPEKGISYSDENDYSMVLKLSYKDFTALFTGDIGTDGEEEMLKAGVLGDVDLLKAAHHGSRYSTSEMFLETVNPEIALISCGRENSYGHPHEELIKRLEKNGVSIWLTPQCGAIMVVPDRKGIKVASYCNS